MEQDDYNKLFKIKRTQVEMVRDRGYDVTDEIGLLTSNLSTFIDFYQSQIAANNRLTFKQALGKTYTRNNVNTGEEEKVTVFYIQNSKNKQGEKAKIGTADMKQFVELIHHENIKHLIIISETEMTTDVRKNVDELDSVRIELFIYDHMTYNVTKHMLVPKHRMMTKKEAKDFLQNNKLTIGTLRQIRNNDPIVNYYGAPPGTIFEITRTNLFVEGLVEHPLDYLVVVNQPLVPPLSINLTVTDSV